MKAIESVRGPSKEVQKCIDSLNEANQKGEIIGIAVALVGLPHENTVQHIAGKFNIATMFGSMEFLREFLLKDRAEYTMEEY